MIFLRAYPELTRLITISKIYALITPESGVKNVDKVLWDKVITAYQALPDKVPSANAKSAGAPATPKP